MDEPGNGNGGGGEGARISFEEARAQMPNRDRVDLLAAFAAETAEELHRLAEMHATAFKDLFELLRERFQLIEARLGADRETGASL